MYIYVYICIYIIFLCKEESFYACPRHYHVGPSQIPRARMRRGGRGKAPDGEQLSGTICHRGEPCGRACEFARTPRAARRLAARAAFDSCRFFSEVEIAPGHHHIFYKPMRIARMLGQNYASIRQLCVSVSDAYTCCEGVILLLFACER